MTRTLAALPMFRELDPKLLVLIEPATSWRRLPAKAWAAESDTFGGNLLMVVHGWVREVVTAGGRETILHDLREGQCFGDPFGGARLERCRGAVAITDSLIIRIPSAPLRQLMRACPDFSETLLREMNERLHGLGQRLGEAAGLKAQHRLWAELLRMARPTARGPMIVSPPPTHSELAARAIMQREAVTKELGVLVRDGIIARERGGIRLLDPDRLLCMLRMALAG